MKPYDVNKMMGQLKKAQIEKVVQCGFEDGALYNDELLKLTDVLVDGRFVLAEKSFDVPWRGSRNQRLIDVPRSLTAGKAVKRDP